ncbi:hypothetical protein GN956_G23557 [Arapaima gigas]
MQDAGCRCWVELPRKLLVADDPSGCQTGDEGLTYAFIFYCLLTRSPASPLIKFYVAGCRNRSQAAETPC